MSIISGSAVSFHEKMNSFIGVSEGVISWPVDDLVAIKAWLEDSSSLAEEAVITLNLQTKSVSYDGVELTELLRHEVDRIVQQINNEKGLSDQVDVTVEEYTSQRLVRAE